MKNLNFVIFCQPELHYHTSAVLATALDTSTLPYRLYQDASSVSQMTDGLCMGGRKVSFDTSKHHSNCYYNMPLPFMMSFIIDVQVLCMQSMLPFLMPEDGTLMDSLLGIGDNLPWQSLTPGAQPHVAAGTQSVVLRGVPNSRLKGYAHFYRLYAAL